MVEKNFAAVDSTLANLHRVEVPAKTSSTVELRPPVPAQAPAFVQNVLAPMIFGDGDDLPVSKMPCDGTYPTGTAQWEKRNIALEIPEWDEALCIQCGKCVLVCPHAVIRAKVYPSDLLASAPESFKSAEPKWKNFASFKYTLQVAPEDCTGCALCIEACPAKSKSEAKHKAINMVPQPEIREREARNWDFFLTLPETPREQLSLTQVKDVQLLPAALRVLRRLRWLRRNSVYQAAHPALRRSHGHRQRHRLLLDLRRQSAHHAIHRQQRRPRRCLVQLAL